MLFERKRTVRKAVVAVRVPGFVVLVLKSCAAEILLPLKMSIKSSLDSSPNGDASNVTCARKPLLGERIQMHVVLAW